MGSVRDLNDIDPAGISILGNNQSLYIWLDILGFSDAVETENRYGELFEKLKKFQELFFVSDNYDTEIISDGIILRIKKPLSELGNDLREIFNEIAEKQFQFILENSLFIRGGIAVGSRFDSPGERNSLFISNGLTRAVKLESSHVDWATIGTNGKTIKIIREQLNIDNDEEYFGLSHAFNKKGQDVFFIDFLNKNEAYLQLLNEKIEEFNKEETRGVRDKYIWLLRHYVHKYGQGSVAACINGAVL